MSSCWFRSNSLSRVQQGSCTPQRGKAKKQKKIPVLKSPFDLQCLPSRKLKFKTLISQNGFKQSAWLTGELTAWSVYLFLGTNTKIHSKFSHHCVYSEISALYGHFAFLSGFLTSFHLSCCSCRLSFLNHQ